MGQKVKGDSHCIYRYGQRATQREMQTVRRKSIVCVRESEGERTAFHFADNRHIHYAEEALNSSSFIYPFQASILFMES